MSQAVKVTANNGEPQQVKTNLLGFSASKLGDFFLSKLARSVSAPRRL